MKLAIFFIFLSFSAYCQDTLALANTFLHNKQYAEAEHILKPFVKHHTSNLKAIELYGDALGHQKKWKACSEQYNILVTHNPETAIYQYKYGGSLGMLALSVNKFKALGIIGDVKRAFLKAAALNPTHLDTRWALVEFYMQLPGFLGGSKSKSLKYANELEQLSKINGYLAKAYIYEYDNDEKRAEEFSLLALKASNLSTFFKTQHRNSMYYQIGKVCADYNKQLDKGERCLIIYLKNHSAKDGVPKGWAYYRLAQIQRHKNNKLEALKWINKAIKALPKYKVFKTEKNRIKAL